MLRQAGAQFNGANFHWGGNVAKSKVKIGEFDVLRLPQGQGESYSLINVISANKILGFGPTLNRSIARAQVYERVSPAVRRPGTPSVCTYTGFPGCPWMMVPPVGPPSIRVATPHRILRLFKSNTALLLVTEKGTANGEANEGAPAENAGSVGHGTPIIRFPGD
jgi:hypothetical protein